MIERTLVVFKPDTLQRRLIGKIITVFEEANFTFVAMKMLHANKDFLNKHYPSTNEWLSLVGGKSLTDYQEKGMDPVKELGTSDPIKIGQMVKGWLVDFMASGPVLAVILEGNDAIKNVRKICGHTLPVKADPGSIRGRFSLDSAELANAEKRPIYNLMHASGEPDEAAFEINLWFPELKK